MSLHRHLKVGSRHPSASVLSGDRWTGTGAEVTDFFDLAISGDVLYASFEDIGTWRSDDRGASWRQVIWWTDPSSDSEADGASEIYAHPEDPQRVYVARSSWSNGIREIPVRSALAKTTDGGDRFSDVTPADVPEIAGRAALAVVWGATPQQDTIFAAFHGDSIHKSADGDASWREISTGLTIEDRELVFSIAVDPDDTDRVFAGMFTDAGEFPSVGGLYRSRDGGTAWTLIEAYPFAEAVTIRFAGNPRRLFVGSWSFGEESANGALLVSDDGGETLRPVSINPSSTTS